MELNLLKREDLPADIITVSPSQLRMWHDCQYKWMLVKLMDIGSQGDREFGAANKGLIFHYFCELLYGNSIGRGVGTLSPKGHELLLKRGLDRFNNDADFYKVYSVFIAYAEWAAKKEELVTVGAEIEGFAPTGLVSRDGRPIYLHGFIDLIAYLFGKLFVVDHKSHTGLRTAWTNERITFDLQLKFYALMLELQGIDVDGAIVNSVDLFVPANPSHFMPNVIRSKDGNRPRFQRFTLKKEELRLQFYYDQIIATIKKMWVDDPTYEMRLGDNCQYCRFREHIDLEARADQETAVRILRQRLDVPANFEVEDVDDLEG